MYEELISDILEFINNRIDSKLIPDSKGSALIEKTYSFIEEYKKRNDLTDCEDYDDLVSSLLAVITYYERRSYKIGLADGLSLHGIKNADIL